MPTYNLFSIDLCKAGQYRPDNILPEMTMKTCDAKDPFDFITKVIANHPPKISNTRHVYFIKFSDVDIVRRNQEFLLSSGWYVVGVHIPRNETNPKPENIHYYDNDPAYGDEWRRIKNRCAFDMSTKYRYENR